MKIILALFTITLFYSCSEPAEADVYFLPTLHYYHSVNKKYSFDSLKAKIRRIDPDIIAVEIRKEDINRDSNYLTKSYPYEMRMMRYWFPDKQIAGIDWLGKEIENKAIPKDFWTSGSIVKNLQRRLQADSVMTARLNECFNRNKERDSLLKILSLEELLVSKDSEIVNLQYECYQKIMKGTRFQKLTEFYSARNEKILENINNLIKENKGKRILILTGDDHFVALKDKFKHN